METTPLVLYSTQSEGSIAVVTLNRPEQRNAVDWYTAKELATAVRKAEADPQVKSIVLTGAGGNFCAGADLKALGTERQNRLTPDGDGPMGISRMFISKPVIAAISGYAVAGGLELACLCDLRVVDETAILGVFCRRFGVPLIDGGTVRLPRLIGLSRALDYILTGRAIRAKEAVEVGLANRLVPKGQACSAAVELAESLNKLPQRCMLSDRESVYRSLGMSTEPAMAQEFSIGVDSLMSGSALEGLQRFNDGHGRHGSTVARSKL